MQPEVVDPPPPPDGEAAGEASSSALLRRLTGTGSGAAPRRHSVLERFGGLLLLAVMFVVFAITLPDKFLTYDNLISVVSNQTIGGIMALALLLPLAAGVFDISIGGAMTLSVVLVTWLFQTTSGDMPIPLAILITLVAGPIIGAVNGALVLKGRVDPFIATIATSSVLLGLSEMIANGTTISQDIPSAFTDLGRTFVAKVPLTVAYVAVVAIVLWYLLDQTPFGRRVYATGAARDAARLVGVRTNRIIFLAFVASATLSVLAGVIYAARVGAGPPNVGAGYLLPAFAAAFLGSTMIRPGRFNVPGLILALFIVAIGINGLQLYGIPFWITDVYQGVVLILAVLVARSRARRA
jgi:ribose transport system permease protein